MGETTGVEKTEIRRRQDRWVQKVLKTDVGTGGLGRGVPLPKVGVNKVVLRRPQPIKRVAPVNKRVLPPPVRIAPPPPPPNRSAKIQQGVEARLMTYDTLVQEVGHAPHDDKLGGKWKMSKKYKALTGQLDESQNKVDALEQKPLTDLRDDRDAVEKELTDQIDQMIAAATTYKNAKKSTGKKKAAQNVIDQANQYKVQLKDNLNKILADPDFAKIAGDTTIGEALAVKIRGINFADCKFDVHNDTKLDKGQSKDGFGSGAVNSVSKLVHQDGTARIFKPEPDRDDKMKKGPKMMGIDPASPHYGNRNVASQSAGDFLGTNVMPEASFATHNGQVGLMMSMAKGKSPRQKKWELLADQNAAEKEAPVNRANYGWEKKDDGLWYKPIIEMKAPWTTPPSPKAVAKLQEELAALEWTDMLTGQCDRHSENYFVDIQGDDVKVTGIDNDFAYGKDQKDLVEYNPGIGVTSAGSAKLIDKKVYDKLIAGNFDRDMKPKLAGLLTDEEIAAAQSRFDKVKIYAASLHPDFVVTDWGAWRAPAPTAGLTAKEFLQQAPGKNLLKRDLASFL